MATQILFLHSAGAQGPNEGSSDLVAYLRRELGPKYRIASPIMPDPGHPSYKGWKTQLEKQLDMVDDEIILVGHSLGGSVLLKYFSETPTQKSITGLFLLAAPFWKRKEDWNVSEYILTEDFGTRLNFIPEIYLYHSLDDEIVPFSHLTTYAEKLPHATVRLLNNCGHNFSNGSQKLIDDIKSLKIRPFHSNIFKNFNYKKMTNSEITQEIDEATSALLRVLAAFREDQIDEIPFENSWTAGQVGEHILKVESGFAPLLTTNIDDTERPFDQNVDTLRSMFLNFDTKMNAPASTVPSEQPHSKEVLMDAIGRNRKTIMEIAENADLTKTCATRPFPTIGNLTRIEWLNFLACHSKRHTHQLENILDKLDEKHEKNA